MSGEWFADNRLLAGGDDRPSEVLGVAMPTYSPDIFTLESALAGFILKLEFLKSEGLTGLSWYEGEINGFCAALRILDHKKYDGKAFDAEWEKTIVIIDGLHDWVCSGC